MRTLVIKVTPDGKATKKASAGEYTSAFVLLSNLYKSKKKQKKQPELNGDNGVELILL